MSDKILKLDQAQTLYQDLRGRIDALPTSEDIPTKVSDLTNDSGYLTSHQNISGKADKADTILDTTLSLGRLANSDVGDNSVALGYDVTASGDYSFATGSETVASSDSAHAEGENTQATDSAAHAEGTYTEANGYGSHAEGDHSVADGWFAHVEGSETTAGGRSTHVFGERNFNCNQSANSSARGTMVEIVGNGQGNAYSNARALTWTGDEYLAGNLYVNANGTSTSGTRVATVTEIPDVPVQDVQIDSTSILQDGVANVPIADANNYGVVKLGDGLRLSTNGTNILLLQVANAGDVRNQNNTHAVTGARSGDVAFYGLAAAAGDTTQRSVVGNGTYTDVAKQKIQNMLGITDLLSTEESSTATAAHALNSTFMMNGKLHRATAEIAIGDAVEVGTNCEIVKADEVFVKNTDIATSAKAGIVKSGTHGIYVGQTGNIVGELVIDYASENTIKIGASYYNPIIPKHQHVAVFYGLSKAAGIDLANETVTVGTYPETSKAAIRTMLGAASPNVIAVQDTQPTNSETKVWLPETQAAGIEVPTMDDLDAYVKKTDYATATNYGLVKVYSECGITINDATKALQINYASLDQCKMRTGSTAYQPLTVYTEHAAAFYGLAYAAGDTTQSQSSNAVGTYTDDAKAAIQTMLGVPGDVQIDGTSIVSNGVANIPIASASTFGAVKCGTGLTMMTGNNAGKINTNPASTSACKNGAEYYAPITPNHQHEATFYGLAKAAGDTTQSASSNAVGTYTTEALSAIHTMLGIDPAAIAAQVEIPLVETVTGTTPSITGQPNTRYNCGEVSTLSITPPASGSIDVIFESGSTPTVITVPNTVKWPAWFDATALEADTTYEILITDGVYGSVMTWAN